MSLPFHLFQHFSSLFGVPPEPEAPIRAELFSLERLEQHAVSLADAQRITTRRSLGRRLVPRVKENARVLRAGYRNITQTVQEERAITPAAEWMIDNFHIVEEQIREIIDDLPPGFYRELPKLADGPLEGFPRVYGVAWAFVAHTDSRLDPDWLRRFVRAYQRTDALRIGEIWALAISLRIVLVENLRRLTDRIVSRQAARHEADILADAILGHKGRSPVPPAEALRDYAVAPLSRAFAVQLVQRLRDQEGRAAVTLQWLDQRLAAQGTAAAEIVQSEHQEQAALNTSVRNVITSMRLLTTWDWALFFEDVSSVDELLRAESQFAKMDFATRDLYRHAIEDLSRGSEVPEVEVAQRAIRAAQAARAEAGHSERESDRVGDPGYYLISKGRFHFEKELRFRPTLRSRFLRVYAAWATPAYLGSVFFGTGIFLGLAVWQGHEAGMSLQNLVLLALLGLIPASDVAVAMVNRIVTDSLGPKILPKLDFTTGVPAALQTMVVMPMILRDQKSVQEDLEQLEIHYLSNPDGHLQFALLSDWPDAAAENAPDDIPLLKTAQEGIRRLNTRYPAPDLETETRFFIFHRRRVWNSQQGVWMGWERKRGKLHQFNRLLRSETATDFLHPGTVPRNTCYVITLDADTRMTRGTAYRLVGAMAHPLNRPAFDLRAGRVVEGFGIMQPRITPTLPMLGFSSLYQRLHSSHAGIDPYAFAISDVYQDLFKEGSYVGKGIYEIDAFQTALAGRAPENALLSHDLFEGLYARAALATDIELFEEFPSHYEVAVDRAHRWARGDWQLLPFIWSPQLPLISRWKIVDNLRRSLSALSLWLGLVYAWSVREPASIGWTWFFLLTLAIPAFLPVILDIIPRRRQISLKNHFRGIAEDLGLALYHIALCVVFLAHQAWVMLDALVRTLYRLGISRRHLLEWKTAALSKNLFDYDVVSFYARMQCAVWLALAAGATAYLAGRPGLEMAGPFVFLWILSPWFAQQVSVPLKDAGARPLLREDQEYLRGIARKTWGFFETFVTAEQNFLPPDNFQEIPRPVTAHRTSPTNIGLYLLSVISAREFGWISVEEAASRLEATLATVKKLQRFKGHLYNWYDTQDLRPLDPHYVSTVDSGNLAGHLWAVGNACRALARLPLKTDGMSETLAQRLTAVARACDQLVEEMPFGFLCDPVKKIFSIGYRVDEQKPDPSYYDLLASESRQTSFVAIAKGDVPADHWFHLARPLVPFHRGVLLLSWSGSMFEYLMPALAMKSPVGSLLDQSCRFAVLRQIEYGRERDVPWGISESGYNAQNLEFTYQYSNFGVPGLGIKRGLSEDLLIAPYATALAAQIDPTTAAENFRRLEKLGALGRYGFYESIDYTATRLPEDQKFVIVQEFMAHHQGMTLVALANVLCAGKIRDYFHVEPRVQATELLLQERSPRDVPLTRPRIDERQGELRSLVPPVLRRFYSPHDTPPRTHLLSNGRYHVMVTAAGSGYSRCRNIAVTRWREDATRDAWGTYFYIRDSQSGEVWSAGYQPVGMEPERYEVDFSEDRAEIIRWDKSIITTLEVVVSPEDDAEIRRVTLKNSDSRPHDIEVTSYAEIVLATPAADQAHPAFSNLFVQTEYVPEVNGLLCSRRPRSSEDPTLWAAHVVVVEGQTIGEVEYESDRARFLGRGRGVRSPASVMDGQPLSNTAGAVLDPIVSLRRRVHLEPGETARLIFTTILAPSEAEAMGLADKYHDLAMFERTVMLAWTHAQIQQHHLDIQPSEAHLYQDMASRIVFSDPGLRPPPELLKRNTRGASALWTYGISGDLPIVLLRIDEEDDRGIVRELLRAHEYWRIKNLAVDLVIINERGASYAQELQTTLDNLVRANQAMLRQEAHITDGDIFVLRADRLSAEDHVLLLSAARMILLSRHGTLAQQMDRVQVAQQIPSAPFLPEWTGKDWLEEIGFSDLMSPPPRAPKKLKSPTSALQFFNGLGGFSQEGNEYQVSLELKQSTPAPWINVITNPEFGFQVSESGAGFTWSMNSRENQLTAWSNDPVTDSSSEVFYIRDEDSGDVWTPTALPIREDATPYSAAHAAGYSRFQHLSHEIRAELLQCVSPDDPVKLSRLTLTNQSNQDRRVSVTAYLEWALGTSRAAGAPFILTEIDPSTGALLAKNPWNSEFGQRVAFVDLLGRQTSWTADRTEFIGRNGALDRPAALRGTEPLSGRVGAGLDPCAALRTVFTLRPGASQEIVFLLGQAANRQAAVDLIQRYRGLPVAQVLEDVQKRWEINLKAVQVRTPDRATDLMLNHWLLYQTLACRLWGRAGFYQAGGAYGFRDQLQDVLALIVPRRDLAREHILRAAARQFPEGDVQHWWHPPTGRGVRTRISDDLVWLPYVVAQYLEVTGDTPILDEAVPFLEGSAIPPGKEDAYFQPQASTETASLFEHCARTLDRSLGVGSHGLPLMGSGDWNDGMNRVGIGGKGESVWLGWFLHTVLWEFAKLAEARGETTRAEKWRVHVSELKAALERSGWDGDWYRRAYFDNGTPLGSVENKECRIDSIAQSWGVLSGAADPARASRAMSAVAEQLVREKEKLVLLFTPPFNQSKPTPGYIEGYLPGVRENGGHYTHAAVWTALAFAALGDGDKAWQLFTMLNPISHALTPEDCERYKVEPYVVAGDIYAEAPHVGRGGWTWYTGSAGWLYRAGMEWILGFRLRGTTLFMDPCIPRAWPGFEVSFRYHSARYEVKVENPKNVCRGIISAEVDGKPVRGGVAILLTDDGAAHHIRIVLG